MHPSSLQTGRDVACSLPCFAICLDVDQLNPRARGAEMRCRRGRGLRSWVAGWGGGVVVGWDGVGFGGWSLVFDGGSVGSR